jgi:hypothetical protein
MKTMPPIPMVRSQAEEVLTEFFSTYVRYPEQAKELAVSVTNLLFETYNGACLDIEGYAYSRRIK